MDRFYSSCEKRQSDTVEKIMTAQDSLCVAAVRGIQTAANFNECKINVFIFFNYFIAN